MVTLLTSSVVFFASLAARLMRLQFGRKPYWAFAIVSSLALSFVSPVWAFYQVMVLLLVGLYADLEEQGIPLFYTAMFAVGMTTTAGFLLLGAWAKLQKMSLTAFLTSQINTAMEATKKIPNFQWVLEPQQIVFLVPAFIAIALMFLIFMSLVFVRRPTTQGMARVVEPITEFHAPDSMVWVFISAIAVYFLWQSPQDNRLLQNISLNLVYLTTAIYYFQGLSIVGFFFKRMQLNYFLKAGLFFLISVHLFAVVVGLGLSDLWFNYRSKWYNKKMVNSPSEEP